MSIIKTRVHQIGVSTTASQNFTAQTPAVPDGTMKLARGLPDATTQDILTVAASGLMSAGLQPKAGDRSAALATMKMFADEFPIAPSANGWTRLPNGMLIQWYTSGSFGVPANGGATIKPVWPIAFPTACLAATATAIADGWTVNTAGAFVFEVGKTGCGCGVTTFSAGQNTKVNLIAIGY